MSKGSGNRTADFGAFRNNYDDIDWGRKPVGECLGLPIYEDPELKPLGITFGAFEPDKPIIGVIMAAYNAERWILPAITSVLGQTYYNVRLAIVDDGSTDRTTEIIESKVRDFRAMLLKREHAGCMAAKAAALELLLHSDAVTHIAIMDADDICDLRRFEKQLRHLDETGVDISFTTYGWINEDAKPLRSMAPRRANATALCKREWYETCGWSDGGDEYESDGRVIERMIKAGATYDVLQEECYLQRRHPWQISMLKRRRR